VKLRCGGGKEEQNMSKVMKDATDSQQVAKGSALVAVVVEATKSLRANRKYVDLDTAEKMTAYAYRAIAGLHEMVAVLEEIKSIRRRQSTTLVGGKRSKA
jgi:hypothetical protein